MTTVVEGSSRHPSRESSRSSSETGARNRSRKKSQQRAVNSSPYGGSSSERGVSSQQARETQDHIGSAPSVYHGACAGFPPDSVDVEDDDMTDQGLHLTPQVIDQRSIEQHHHDHLTQQYVDQRSVDHAEKQTKPGQQP